MTLCIPAAKGVPGLYRQPPTWPNVDPSDPRAGFPVWANTAPPSHTTPAGLDDPRWQGSLKVGHPNIATSGVGAEFRALHHVAAGGQKSLYLSWDVRVDTTVEHTGDVLWVGFERQAGNPMIVMVQPTSSVPVLGDLAAAFNRWTIDPSTAQDCPGVAGQSRAPVVNWSENGGATPAWLNQNTRVWREGQRWAVMMRVPIGTDVNAAVDLADNFKLWYQLTVECPEATCIPHRFPYEACPVSSFGAPSTPHVPALTNWADVSTDPACTPTEAVTLAATDVGTTNPVTSEINLVSSNTFRAAPTNGTTNVIGPNRIKATFRMANWGSVADPAASWEKIPATSGTNPAENSSPIDPTTKGNLTFGWQVDPMSEAPRFDPVQGGTPHQCILVELEGAGLTFAPASVWRNMDFIDASTFQRPAEISAVGLGPGRVPGAPRDAYILVEKLNMPPVASEQPPQRPPEIGQERGRQSPSEIERDVNDDHNDEDDPSKDGKALEEAAEAGASEMERLEATMPTIRYHVYHDSGIEVATQGGTPCTVLQAATSFGYFVQHDGTPAGWRDEIVGATEIAPGFYRLSVPVEGVAHVTTVIEAVEPGRRGALGCLLGLLGLPLRILRGLLSLPVKLVRGLVAAARRLRGR